MWPCLSSRMLLAHQVPRPQEQQGWGRGIPLLRCQIGQCYQICTPKPVPVPSPEAEAYLQEPGFCVGHRNPLNPLKDRGGLSLRTHLRLLKETPDSGLVRNGELLCLGLPTQDMMDSMVLQ